MAYNNRRDSGEQREQVPAHPDFLDVVEMLRGYGDKSKFVVVAMSQNKPVDVAVHQVNENSHRYINGSTWEMRQNGADYCHVFAGIRMFGHKIEGYGYVQLPYPPEDFGEGKGKGRRS